MNYEFSSFVERITFLIHRYRSKTEISMKKKDVQGLVHIINELDKKVILAELELTQNIASHTRKEHRLLEEIESLKEEYKDLKERNDNLLSKIKTLKAQDAELERLRKENWDLSSYPDKVHAFRTRIKMLEKGLLDKPVWKNCKTEPPKRDGYYLVRGIGCAVVPVIYFFRALESLCDRGWTKNMPVYMYNSLEKFEWTNLPV